MARAYRAFISYSHRDERAARRLHRRLESYRPPRRLAEGAATPPRRIAPVFRDRDELATSDDLSGRIREALAASETLVVLCSPAAAESRWVNKEIEEFAALRGAGAIHAVIVAGRAPDAFPPALRALSAEPLAADLTEAGDGFDDGALKLVAGLLPAPYGEVKNREVARVRARARVNGGIALAFALLALFAGWSAWRAMEETRAREAELTRAEAAILAAVEGISGIVDQVAAGGDRGDIPVSLAAALLSAAQGMADNVVALAPDNPRLARAYGGLLVQLSRHHRRAGDLAKAADAADRAETAFAALAATGDDHALKWKAGALLERGDTAFAVGDLAAALAAYVEGLEILRGLARRSEAGAGALRDASLTLNKIGHIRMAGADLPGALAAYEEGLELARSAARQSPGEPSLGLDVSASLVGVGDVRRASGDLPGALAAYLEGLGVARDLARRDAQNAEWARGLSVCLERVGDVRRSMGELAGALSAYSEGLRTRRSLSQRDPANTDWSRDVGVSLNKVGATLASQGDVAGATAAFEESLAIARALAAQDPGNADWSRDLVVTYARLAGVDAARAAERWAEAVAVVEDMDRRGVLAPADRWMLDDTRRQLAAARAR